MGEEGGEEGEGGDEDEGDEVWMIKEDFEGFSE